MTTKPPGCKPPIFGSRQRQVLGSGMSGPVQLATGTGARSSLELDVCVCVLPFGQGSLYFPFWWFETLPFGP